MPAQYFVRFKNSFHGLVDKSIYAVDASAHHDNIHEAVVQHVVNVVRQAFDSRNAQILDPLSTARIRVAFHAAQPQPARRDKPTTLLDLMELTYA